MSGMNERALSLLKLVGLEDRAVYSDELEKIAALADTPVDWEDVDSRLDQQRDLARQFLESALESRQ